MHRFECFIVTRQMIIRLTLPLPTRKTVDTASIHLHICTIFLTFVYVCAHISKNSFLVH